MFKSIRYYFSKDPLNLVGKTFKCHFRRSINHKLENRFKFGLFVEYEKPSYSILWMNFEDDTTEPAFWIDHYYEREEIESKFRRGNWVIE